MNLYQEEIIEHYKNPHHKGRLESPTVSVSSVNPTCGDTLGLDVCITDGVIQNVGFWGQGCAISQAAMSMISDDLIGKSVEHLGDYQENDILSMLGVPIGPNRKKCAFLCLDVLRKIYEHKESKKS